MAKPLNFNNVKKNYLSVTLADEKETTLLIGTPTKAIMEDLMVIQSGLETAEEDEITPEVLDDLYRACARVMSRNKCGVEITGEYLGELFDFEDIMLFFTSYMNFIDEVVGSKN
jgi:hypothetical protein